MTFSYSFSLISGYFLMTSCSHIYQIIIPTRARLIFLLYTVSQICFKSQSCPFFSDLECILYFFHIPRTIAVYFFYCIPMKGVEYLSNMCGVVMNTAGDTPQGREKPRWRRVSHSFSSCRVARTFRKPCGSNALKLLSTRTQPDKDLFWHTDMCHRKCLGVWLLVTPPGLYAVTEVVSSKHSLHKI